MITPSWVPVINPALTTVASFTDAPAADVPTPRIVAPCLLMRLPLNTTAPVFPDMRP